MNNPKSKMLFRNYSCLYISCVAINLETTHHSLLYGYIWRGDKKARNKIAAAILSQKKCDGVCWTEAHGQTHKNFQILRLCCKMST